MVVTAYVPHPLRDERRRSAIAWAKAIVSVRSELTEPHFRQAISYAVWKFTEADGKQNLRYRSEVVHLGTDKSVRHEHVVTRLSLVDAMSRPDVDVAKVMETATACSVTAAEHDRLNRVPPDSAGWDRYLSAGIRVWDDVEKRWIV